MKISTFTLSRPDFYWLFLLNLFIALPAGITGAEASSSQSLVKNGNFEKADVRNNTKPAGWSQPDGLGIQWIMAPRHANGQSHGKAIRIDTAISEKVMNEQWKKMGMTEWIIPKPADNPVADTYGLSFYSDPVPVKPGQAYRVEFDFMGPSGGAKLWVRGYGFFKGEKRRRYEVIVNCRASKDQWTTFSQEFHPTKLSPEVTEMKVMLYAYWPSGVYWFDNVRIMPVADEAKEE